MAIQHSRIPVLPSRSVMYPIARKIRRSYPVGRSSFSRSCQRKKMTLTIKTDEELPVNIQANIVSTMNSDDGVEWKEVPFIRVNGHTLMCQIKPKHPGLHSLRAEFSLDDGKTWFRDSVADAWVLVDPPQVDGLRLYTLIPNISGSISDWKADLKRIKEMGFNAIHLLPLTTLDTSESPYSAKDLFQIDPMYLDPDSESGGLEQLEDFIEEAKELNIKLCFDLVLNHVGIDSKIAKKAPDWIIPDATRADGLCRASYWCDQGKLFWDDLVLINYEHPSHAIRSEIWSYMTDYALFWSKHANDTGGFVRFDNLHSSYPDFIKELTQKMHKEYPDIAIIAEYFADESVLLHTGSEWGLNLNLATPWDSKFVPQLREYLKYIHRVSKHIRYLMPITSHDSGTPTQEFGGANSTVPRYVAAALLGTGATGIVQGVEFGEKEKIDFIGRKPKKTFPKEAIFGLFIGRVNEILVKHTAFRQGGNCVFVDQSHDAILAAYRQSERKQVYGFLVVCNFDIGNEQRIDIDLSEQIETNTPLYYRELISEKEGVFPKPQIDLKLPACEAYVFMLFSK